MLTLTYCFHAVGTFVRAASVLLTFGTLSVHFSLCVELYMSTVLASSLLLAAVSHYSMRHVS